MQDRFFTDEELVAFLDGEDDLAPVADIQRALTSDKALEKRLDALRIDRDAISDSFKDLLPDESSIPDFAAMQVPRARFGLQSVAAVASVALLVGLGMGAWFNNEERSGWVDYVAAYQALYTNATLSHIDQDNASKQAELDRVAPAIGKTISVEMLDVFPDADYKRAQVLGFEGRALLQLAFTTSTGEPLALCIIRSDRGTDAGPQVDEMEGLSTAWWSKDGYEYLLIGGTDGALVSRIASSFSSMEL